MLGGGPSPPRVGLSTTPSPTRSSRTALDPSPAQPEDEPAAEAAAEVDPEAAAAEEEEVKEETLEIPAVAEDNEDEEDNGEAVSAFLPYPQLLFSFAFCAFGAGVAKVSHGYLQFNYYRESLRKCKKKI